MIDNCILGITANEKHCKELVDKSVGIITALCPYLGYEATALIAKEAIITGASVRDLILRDELLSEEELDDILNPYSMTKAGIAGNKMTQKYVVNY